MKKILITGPESSGKTTMAQALAKYFNCPWVAEYARVYLKELDHPYQEEDLAKICLGQLAAEQLATASHHPFLFCDTGPEVIYIWSKVKYGRVAPLIKQSLHSHHYDLRIICYPDLVWEKDLHREASDDDLRLQLFQQYCQLHEENKWPYIIAKGQSKDRILPFLKMKI